MTHLYHHKSKIKSTHQKKCEWKRSVWWRCSLKLSTICKWCGWWLMCFYIANVLMENVLQSSTYNAYIFYIENDRWRERTGTIRIMYALFILLFNCNEFKRKYVQSISIIVVYGIDRVYQCYNALCGCVHVLRSIICLLPSICVWIWMHDMLKVKGTCCSWLICMWNTILALSR